MCAVMKKWFTVLYFKLGSGRFFMIGINGPRRVRTVCNIIWASPRRRRISAPQMHRAADSLWPSARDAGRRRPADGPARATPARPRAATGPPSRVWPSSEAVNFQLIWHYADELMAARVPQPLSLVVYNWERKPVLHLIPSDSPSWFSGRRTARFLSSSHTFGTRASRSGLSYFIR